jgi:RimJ/RimL family protein N-acetyltransferase
MTSMRFDPISRSVRNHFTGETFQLAAVSDAVCCGAEQLDQIVVICNQPLVYGQLFESNLAGRPYSLADARWFVDWAKRGWQEQTHFVFLIMDAKRNVIGAADIKSADLASAEIGYWMSALCPGVMTNAVVALCDIASETGYRSLFGHVEERNTRSANVLVRAGFVYRGLDTVDGETFQRFERYLSADNTVRSAQISPKGLSG